MTELYNSLPFLFCCPCTSIKCPFFLLFFLGGGVAFSSVFTIRFLSKVRFLSLLFYMYVSYYYCYTYSTRSIFLSLFRIHYALLTFVERTYYLTIHFCRVYTISCGRWLLFHYAVRLLWHLLDAYVMCVGGDIAQLVEHRTSTLPTQVRFPGAARDFSPKVNFQGRLSYGVRKTQCAIARIYICVHVKDPVVHVRVRWIMETLKHPACTLGWVARLCCSWLSPGKATRIFSES